MIWDDLRKLLAGTTLYRLDGLIGAKLVPVLYALGLAAIGLWAIGHLVASFTFNFGQGLWSILEILVYGPLLLVGLRIVAEGVLVLFKAHASTAAAVDLSRGRSTLMDDVSDAIRDLAEDDDDGIIPATDPAPYTARHDVAPSPDEIDPPSTETEPRKPGGRPPRAKS